MGMIERLGKVYDMMDNKFECSSWIGFDDWTFVGIANMKIFSSQIDITGCDYVLVEPPVDRFISFLFVIISHRQHVILCTSCFDEYS